MSRFSDKESFSLMLIQIGSTPAIRICNASSPIVCRFGIFAAIPEMKVEPITTTGSVEDPSVRFQLPLGDLGFVRDLERGVAVGQIKVTIYELHRRGAWQQVRTRASGIAKQTAANSSGKEGLMVFELANEKELLKFKAGIPCLDVCDNTLGDVNTCKVDLTNEIKTGVLTAIIDDYILQIDGLPARTLGHWVTGDVEFQGTVVKIVDWDGNNLFIVDDNVSEDWLAQTMTVTPGCDGTLTVCEQRWNNVENFLGLGIAMVPYNPIFENPER